MVLICWPSGQEGLGGTPKIADVSLRDSHHLSRASHSQSSLSSMGSKMLQSTKLTLLDLIHQYKSSRQSNDSSIAAQRRKVPSLFNPPCPGRFDLQVHNGHAISSRQSSVHKHRRLATMANTWPCSSRQSSVQNKVLANSLVFCACATSIGPGEYAAVACSYSWQCSDGKEGEKFCCSGNGSVCR